VSLCVNDVVTNEIETSFAHLYPVMFVGSCRIVLVPAALLEIVRSLGANRLQTEAGSSN